MNLPVTFGEGSIGEKGDTGPQGPMGGAPDEYGNVVLDPATRVITGPFSLEHVEKITTTGTAQQIFRAYFANAEAAQLVFTFKAQNSDASKVQTLDGVRRVKVSSFVLSATVSGTDIADDADALGAVFAVTTGQFSGVYWVDFSATLAAGGSVTCSIRVLR